ncbi:MAG: hypothetical protein KDC54_20560 [Lewinella sp.]|nr:hypothetical protein [Lewinella sp.]
MKRTVNYIVCLGLIIGVGFGFSGMFIKDPTLQVGWYEISSVGLIVALTMLALHFFRKEQELLAAGFMIFAIGEGLMTVGAAGDLGMSVASFGAGMALYPPALWLIVAEKEMPFWTRLTGLAASIPFAISAVKIFGGQVITSADPVVGAAYGLLTLTIIGWVIHFWPRRAVATEQAVA